MMNPGDGPDGGAAPDLLASLAPMGGGFGPQAAKALFEAGDNIMELTLRGRLKPTDQASFILTMLDAADDDLPADLRNGLTMGCTLKVAAGIGEGGKSRDEYVKALDATRFSGMGRGGRGGGRRWPF